MIRFSLLSAVCVCACCTPVARATTIAMVPVGNPGNSNDTTGFGGVSNPYQIGEFEITNSQYVDFLNAVARLDTNSLYFATMTSTVSGGINRSGSNGSYVYAAKPDMGNKPVNWVNYWSVLRFVNWLHNGQPTGAQGNTTTEDGAYTLTAAAISANSVTRNAGARWFLPTANEWYKAAYHKNDGVTNHYWSYPTQSNTAPYSDQPPGSGAPQPSNTANMFADDQLSNGYNDGFAVTGSPFQDNPLQVYLTDVGAYVSALSPYGTYDQAGNVNEWIDDRPSDTSRGIRGGYWLTEPNISISSFVNDITATTRSQSVGFRVAAVPEPSGLMPLAAAALIVLLLPRKIFPAQTSRWE
jgi:formylglycine-generating enzyme